MTASLTAAILFVFTVTESCTKSNNMPYADLHMIQHKWALVSQNGEALRYVGKPGEYFDFDSTGVLFEHFLNVTDTFDYNVSSDGKKLVLYSVLNGAKSGTGVNYNIDILTDSQFIFSSHSSNPPVNFVDSLRR